MNTGDLDKFYSRIDRHLEPFRPSREEVRSKYGHLIEQWKTEWLAARRPQFRETVFKLINGLRLRVAEGVREFQEGLDAVTRSAAPLGLTRGATPKGAEVPEGTDAEGRKRLHYVGDGERCRANLVVTPATGTNVTMRFSLADEAGAAIYPFRLTIEDLAGEILLDPVEVTAGEYEIADFEMSPMRVTFEAADGRRVVLVLDLAVEP